MAGSGKSVGFSHYKKISTFIDQSSVEGFLSSLSSRVGGLGDLELPFGRPVLEVTQRQRDKLRDSFTRVGSRGVSAHEVLMATTPDAELVNTLLEQCGGHYAETVNAVQTCKVPHLALTGAPKPSLGFHGKRSCLSSRRRGCGDGAGKPFPGAG